MDHTATDKPPAVSVVVITYQHVHFIENCIRGILEQRTDLDVELLIGEDDSTDGTREICVRYADQYPDRIRVFLRSRSEAVDLQGKPSGRPNLVQTLSAARGKYIALCEGDDHWIDPLKLQRQFDAMELDTEATGCFTNAYNEQDGERKVFLGDYTKALDRPILVETDYVSGQGIPTCTFLFRSAHLTQYLNVLPWFATGDTALFTLLLGHGHFIYQPYLTAVRVMHPGGVYSMKGTLNNLRVQLKNLPAQDRLTNGRYTQVIAQRRVRSVRYAWNEAMRRQDMQLAKAVWPHVRRERKALGWSVPRTLVNCALAHHPDLVHSLVKWKHTVGRLFRMGTKNTQL